jgi:hypothetical protein
MNERNIRSLRYLGASLLFGMLLLGAIVIGTHLGSQQHCSTQARSLGPSVSHLERTASSLTHGSTSPTS